MTVQHPLDSESYWRVGTVGCEVKAIFCQSSDQESKSPTVWVTDQKFANQADADAYIRDLVRLNMIPEPYYTELADVTEATEVTTRPRLYLVPDL